MRVLANAGPLTVQAISGVSVVLLGMDLTEAQSTSLLGFSIRRTDHTEGQRRWLNNLLAFKENDDARTTGYSSLTNPVQTFRWGDYTAKPGHQYTYLVRAQGGTSTALTPLAELELTVSTESADDGEHQILFNRGVIASQLYAHRFGNKQPRDVPNRAAYQWLSAGLEEAMLAFIGQASNSEWALRAAVYEFNYAPVLQAFRVAADSGADVRIVSDAVGPSDANPKASNAAAITASGLTNCMMPRTHIAIAHNKFVVALHNGVPVAVWTGSTNITEGGIFGQSNVGHTVRDQTVAQRYLDYWDQLVGNPFQRVLKPWNDSRPAVPVAPIPAGTTTVFSPRSTIAALDWYATIADGATRGLFLTAAFGVSPQLMNVLTKDRDYLKYVVLDTDTAGAQLTIRDADPDNQVAVGAPIGKAGWGQWIKEVTLDANKHVRYIHDKFMLIDPLGDDPIVITGSANFSKASTISNDENMLVIRGNKRVADIYLTTFMRLFTHYEFRAAVSTPRRAAAAQPAASALTRGRRFLDPTADWVKRWYQTGSSRVRERHMFAGTSP